MTQPLVERRGGARLEGSARDGALAALEVLPRLLARAACKAEPLRPAGGKLRMDLDGLGGPQYAELVVVELCRLSWPSGCQTKLVECLKDLSLPPGLLKGAAAKACRQLREVLLRRPEDGCV